MSLRNTNVATKESWLQETNKKTEFPFKLTMDGSIFCKACEMFFLTGTKNWKFNVMSTVKATTRIFLWKKSEIITRLCIEHWMGYVRGWYGLRFQNRMCSVKNSVSFFQLFNVTQMSPNSDFDVTKSAFLMSPKCHQRTILMSPVTRLW